MSQQKRRYEVEILGARYSIVSGRDERHVQEIAEAVDRFARQIVESRRGFSSLDAAVLTALNFADAHWEKEETLKEVKRELFARISGLIRTVDAYLESHDPDKH